MQSSNSSFDLKNDARVKSPVYLAAFDGITERFATGDVQSPAAQTKPWLLAPSGHSARIEPLRGRADLGDLQLTILDKDGALTALFQQKIMLEREVTLFGGYSGLDESDYLVLFRGRVAGLRLTQEGGAYTLDCVDLRRTEKKEIFTNLAETDTAETFDENSTELVVLDASAFDASGFVKVGSELLAYANHSADRFSGLTRQAENFGEMQDRSAGARVTQVTPLEGNPVDLALEILTSTGAGTNGPYDVLPSSQGLGVPASLVDTASFELVRDRWVWGTFRFYFLRSTEAKRFLEAEIYQLINAYPVITGEGKIALKAYAPPLLIDPQIVLDESCVLGLPAWSAGFEGLVNRVEIAFDHDPVEDEFLSSLVLEDEDSIASFGRTVTLKIESRGLRSNLNGLFMTRVRAGRMLQRFSVPPARVNVETFFSKRLVEGGDRIKLTHSMLPDLETGARGLTEEIFEVVERKTDFKRGRMQFRLMGTPYTVAGATRRYAVVGPNSLPDYGSATDDEQRYGFIAGNDAKMGDASDAYRIA